MKYTRKRRFVEKRLQLKFGVMFLSLSCLAALVQTIILAFFVSRFAGRLPNDGLLLRSGVPELIWTSLGLSLLLFTPLAFILGIRTTFPLLGPLHRIRVYLNDLERGVATGPCKIRKTDELHDLCDALNRATAPLLREEASGDEKAA